MAAVTFELTVDVDVSEVDDEWKASFTRDLATFLGISASRVFVEFLRGGSVILGVRIIDLDEMGDELSAAESSKFLANRVATSALPIAIAGHRLVSIVRSPSPPPPPPLPSLPTLNSSLALSGGGDEVPDPCAASDAATFFNVSLECTPQFNVGTLRLTVLVCVGGGVLVAALLAVLWFVGFDDEDRRSVEDPFHTGKRARERRASDEAKQTAKAAGKKLSMKEHSKRIKAHVKHPFLGYWRMSLVGLLDLLTDVLFCTSLYYEGLGSADDMGRIGPFLYASAGCIGVSVVFSFSATLWLYFRDPTELSRSVFDVAEKSHRKLVFFIVILLSALVNVKLVALLPWKQKHRRGLLVRIQRVYLIAKCIEDLPQLVISATYLVSRGELSGSAAGTAVLNIAISGTSFLLTLAWLGLQVADSARRHAMSGKTHSGKSRWPGMGTVKNLNPFSSRSHRKGMAVSGNDPGITITHGAPGQGSTVASCEDLVVTGEVTAVSEADQAKTEDSGKVDTEPSLAADEAPYIGVGTSRRRISMLPSFTEKQVTTKL